MARPRGATAKRIFHAGRLYSVKDLAELRGVTPQVIYKMMESGRSVAHIISGAKGNPGGPGTRSNPSALFHGYEDELGEIAERRALLAAAQKGDEDSKRELVARYGLRRWERNGTVVVGEVHPCHAS